MNKINQNMMCKRKRERENMFVEWNEQQQECKHVRMKMWNEEKLNEIRKWKTIDWKIRLSLSFSLLWQATYVKQHEIERNLFSWSS